MESMKDILVSANPGSGKTYNLSVEVANFINNGNNPDKILCLTFTRKARDHMEEAIVERLSDATKVPRIMTFHGLANSIIVERHGASKPIPERLMRYEISKSLQERSVMNYDISVLMKDYPSIVNVGQITNAIRFLKSFGILPPSIDIEAMKSYIKEQYGKDQGVSGYSREEMLVLAKRFVEIFSDYEKSKMKGELDYNDQLLHAIEIVKIYSRKFERVFIDEVQDMSGIEYELVKHVAKTIYAVGDMKQAIFGFQGGDIKPLLQMKSRGDIENQIIEGTRRLTENVMEYCRNFYTAYTRQDLGNELLKFKSNRGGTSELEILKCKDQAEIEDAVLQKLKTFPESETVGIIVRTNAQATAISSFLTENGVKHQRISGTKGNREWREDIANFIVGIFGGQSEMISMIYSRFSGIDLEHAVQIVDRLRFAKNPSELLPEEILRCRMSYGKNLDGLKGLFTDYLIPVSLKFGQECVETVSEVYNSLPHFLERVKKGLDTDLRDIADYIMQENTYENVEDITENISLITVHKAKGLEFDHVVYVPLGQKKHSISAVDMITGSIMSQKQIEYGEDQRVEEECRIDFVAMTRTKGSLTIACKNDNFSRYVIDPINIKTFSPERGKSEFVSMKDLLTVSTMRERHDPWLLAFMEKKLSKLNKLSYTMLQKTLNLPDFIQSYILGIQFKTTALAFGTNIHALIEEYIKNHTPPPLLSDDKDSKTWANFMSYDRYIREELKGRWEGSELVMKKRIDEVFSDMRSQLTIEGRIDGVYTYDTPAGKKTIIVDFKTSKRADQNYALQLSLYAKLYSLVKGTNLDSMGSEISYLSLRDAKVNLGEYGKKWDRFDPVIVKRGLEEIKNMANKFSQYRNSIDIFAGDIMQIKSSDNRLIREIQAIIRDEIEQKAINKSQ